ncbi:hypothetical protein [Streptococcus gordonii]|uniref:Uncharacterized protein n=1 Tax=Streptococcus gordonii (strain Challis / ATCC 35105 / BCRC 15272 / CH1 / DL1 / V288) TaxID=467705 RepID=A8AX45_STRGC|nr:hypothetical protein [Streptococcus gordonii]ABV11149.1 hypothetical protein SGO_1066 [Streptococcus gordonii str. Challis substr. CH1]MBZ2138178.1 hypothetical protein [Streptococcus gordonii]QGS43430.1 hypothetical protein FOB91_01385 [Streptococcus gordonii]VEE21324.1 Uncharacterised protein [Streptococcus gordonii]VTS79864.1 Uncharacterised protein [Streptococcus gordonii]
MALNDEQVQQLQTRVLKIIKNHYVGEDFSLKRGGQKYVLINEVNETTQAIAVAPLDKEGKPDYSQTTIVVAGTQDPDGDINNHVIESGFNAATARVQLTEQTKDVREFYNQSLSKAKKMAGTGQEVDISNMSGFSQSGPAVAKVAAEMKVQKITNFMDWGAWASLYKNSSDYKGISNEELAYLNKHLHSYSDQGKDLTSWDGHGGIIPYGKVFTVEGKHHNAGLPKIKGNSPDFEWYEKNGLFCSGMTKSQVEKIVDKRLSKSSIDNAYKTMARPELIRRYELEYGPFSPEPSKQDLITINREYIDELHASLRTSSGDKTISLREELVRTSAQTAQLQAEVYEQEIKDKLASAKSKVEEHISELSKAAYTLAHNLSAGEVEELLSELSLSTAWNGGTEASTLASASGYTTKMTEIAGNLNKAADNIVAIDQKGAQIFTKK